MSNLTPKQEKFCRKYIEVSSPSKAYKLAYDAGKMKPNVISVKANDLLNNGKVAVRIKELQDLGTKQHLVTVGSITDELDKARQVAEEIKNPTAMVTAAMGKAKLHGLITDKVKQEGKLSVTVKQALKDMQGVNTGLPSDYV